MPRRRVRTDAQLEGLLALPRTEPDLIRYWTLEATDLTAIARRRGGGNRLGYALQLCAFRFPGRLLRPGEALPQPALDFVAEQIHVTPDELATYAARRQTRQEQLDEQRETFGFRMYGADQAREVSAWLLPIALATTDIPGIAAALMDEFRRRRIVAPGPTVIERLVAAVLVSAERHVTEQLTRGLSPRQTEALNGLLTLNEGGSTSVLAWARQPPGAPNHKALMRTDIESAPDGVRRQPLYGWPLGAGAVHPINPRCPARPPYPARIAAYRPDRGLSLGCRRRRGDGRVQAAGAPQALKVTDRWHLLENATAAFVEAVKRRMGDLRRAIAGDGVDPEAFSAAEKKQWAGWQRRDEVNGTVRSLHGQGHSIKGIVKITGVSRQTVRRILAGTRDDVFRSRATTLDRWAERLSG